MTVQYGDYCNVIALLGITSYIPDTLYFDLRSLKTMSLSEKFALEASEVYDRNKTAFTCILGMIVGIFFALAMITCVISDEEQYSNQNENELCFPSPNPCRDFWKEFEQFQSWASDGRFSDHFEKTLVPTSWLTDILSGKSESTESIRIFDTSTSSFANDKKLYRQEHITDALFFDHFRCVNRSRLFPRNLPEQVCFQHYLRILGIHDDTRVIVYDRYNRRSSARVWWILRLHGHTKVSILDGGFDKWKSEGHPTTTVIPIVQASNFQINFNPFLLRDFESMSLNYDSNIEVVVDSRKKIYFTGELTEKGLKAGHIPGAVNVPYEEMFNDDQTFKSAQELKILFRSAGIDFEKPVVAMCTTAMRATGTAVAFHIMGWVIPVYHGSWTEWSQQADPDRIVNEK